MRVVKISDAKNNLSRHLAYVRRGGRVRILDRDVPVADLVPVEIGRGADDEDAMLADLERRGIVRRGTSAIPPEILKPGPPGATIRQALLAERRAGR
jgi:antitoxin (DNA-binding transcriptional repressor) of toxin-antitoxin stability system